MLRRSKRTSGTTKASSKDEDKLSALFEKYKDGDSDDIGPVGVERLCSDIGVDPSDRKVLLLAWKMGAERMGYFSRVEFLRGMAALKLTDLSKASNALAQVEVEVEEEEGPYKDFFHFAFKFLLTEPRQRIIELDTAVEMLGIAMRPDEPHLEPFCAFLQQQTEYKSVNNDQWMGFFRFCQEVSADCSDYDESSAWPLLLDNYVEWRRQQTAS